MGWVEKTGNVPVFTALQRVMGWRSTAWWRHRSVWGIRVDSVNVARWKTPVEGITIEEVIWDTPMSAWSGPGTDWIHKRKGWMVEGRGSE